MWQNYVSRGTATTEPLKYLKTPVAMNIDFKLILGNLYRFIFISTFFLLGCMQAVALFFRDPRGKRFLCVHVPVNDISNVK